MATIIKFLGCDKCDNNGTVKVIQKEMKSSVSFSVGDCDKCGYSFGMKSVSLLTKIQAPKS